MALARCEGLIIRVKDFGEADRILTVLSGSDGKFDVVARGARRHRSRFVGVTQQFSRVNLMAYRGKNLDTLSTAEMISVHHNLLTDVTRMAYASYAAELLDKMVGERERNEGLYSLAVATFDALNSLDADPAGVSLSFEIKLMTVLGFQPELSRCALCAAPADDAPWFGPDAGGLLCSRCVSQDRGAVAFSAPSREFAKRMLEWGYDRLAVLKPGDDTTAQLEQAFRAYVDHRVERKLHSLDFIRELKMMERRDTGES